METIRDERKSGLRVKEESDRGNEKKKSEKEIGMSERFCQARFNESAIFKISFDVFLNRCAS